MAEEIPFKNVLIFNFKGLMTLTLDQVILHTVVHHSSTSAYNCEQNFHSLNTQSVIIETTEFNDNQTFVRSLSHEWR